MLVADAPLGRRADVRGLEASPERRRVWREGREEKVTGVGWRGIDGVR